jgi:hypothetical protein
MSQIVVTCRVAGAGLDQPDVPTVLFDLGSQPVTAAELIRRAVEEQLRELAASRALSAEQRRRALDRQYLTDEEIRRQAASGAVGRTPRSREAPAGDPGEEVDRALGAFESGSFVLIVEGRQVERLDEVVDTGLGARVTFVRLVPLVGG